MSACLADAAAPNHDASAPDDVEVLDWASFGQASRKLAQKIINSGFVPDLVIAVARGGLIPSGALAYALGIKLADCINVEFYTDIHATLSDPVLLAPLLDTEAIRGKKILVVDDVVDSGRTLALVIKLLDGLDADVRSTVLYKKPTSIVEPDYFWQHTDKWIIFPWSAQLPVVTEAS